MSASIAALVSPQMLQRRVIWDAIEDPARACKLVGLVGAGDDGDRAETEASHARLNRVAILIPMLTEFSHWLSTLATQIQLEGQDVNEEFTEQMAMMFFSVVQSSVIATISVLVDLDILELNVEPGL